MTINRTELITRIADGAELSKASATRALDVTLWAIAHELEMGGDVRLSEFSAFTVAHTKARDGRNPSTGDKIKIAAQRRPKFTAAKALKERLNPVRLTGARRRA